MKNEYFECSCHSPEHTLKFILDDDEDFPALYAYVFLEKVPWYKRIINSVRYVLGHTSKYGYFTEFIFNPEDCDRLIGLIKKLKKLNHLTSKKRVQK